MSWIWQAGGGGGGGGGALAKYPQLTQTLYSPVAQWALDSTQPGGQTNDRSGNGRHLSAFQSAMRPGPAMRLPPAKATVWPARAPGQGYVLVCPTLNATSFPGAMTLTCKVWWRPSDFASIDPVDYQIIVGASSIAAPETTAWLYAGLTSRVGSFWAGGAPDNFESTQTLSSRAGKWVWLSMQREAGTFVTRIGVDGVYETSGPRSGQTAPATANFRIGAWAFSPGQSWYGGMEDISIWNTRLADADLEGLRTYAMGL